LSLDLGKISQASNSHQQKLKSSETVVAQKFRSTKRYLSAARNKVKAFVVCNTHFCGWLSQLLLFIRGLKDTTFGIC